jgi:SAM-dependent methyltransferase
MRLAASTSSDQHSREIRTNLASWERKPLLRAIYGEFYRQIAQRIQTRADGLIVEIGSGIGKAKEFVPGCITTDIFPNPWLDRLENAYALSFADATISHLILFDVWHHLQYPGTALKEFHRVLAKNGRVILFDPAVGLLGWLTYGLFHHEPLGLGKEITWEAPAGFTAGTAEYYAAQGNAARVFGDSRFKNQLSGWRLSEVCYFPALPYLACGGFRRFQLYPLSLLPLVRGIDRLLSLVPRFFASRMLVVLEKS